MPEFFYLACLVLGADFKNWSLFSSSFSMHQKEEYLITVAVANQRHVSKKASSAANKEQWVLMSHNNFICFCKKHLLKTENSLCILENDLTFKLFFLDKML